MIRAGDVIAVRGRGWLADHIVRATGPARAPNGLLYEVSHVGMITATEPNIQVTEALTRVDTHPIETTLDACEHAWILSPEITNLERDALTRRALKFTAADYGYYDILLQLMNATTRTTWWTDHLYFSGDKTPICSYLVAVSFDDELHWTFGKGDRTTTPKDCMQWALNNRQQWPNVVAQK